MQELSLEIDRVTINRNNWSLGNVKLSLEKGDILGLVGRSGSGKSTLIKSIIGEIRPSSGSINLKVDGKKQSIIGHVGYSPQDHALYENLTVQENLKIFGRLRRLSNKEIEERGEKLLARLKLKGAKNKQIAKLSGGMRKRADLAVSLLHNPSVLVLDEPLTGLDVALQKFIWELIKELSEEGHIIILSSHDLDDVENNCKQYGLIRDGHFYNTEHLLEKVKGQRKYVSEYLRKLFEEDANKEMAR